MPGLADLGSNAEVPRGEFERDRRVGSFHPALPEASKQQRNSEDDAVGIFENVCWTDVFVVADGEAVALERADRLQLMLHLGEDHLTLTTGPIEGHEKFAVKAAYVSLDRGW